MTKQDLVNEIAKRTGLEKKLIQETIEATMSVIKDSLIRRESVYLRGFGSFNVKHRAKKTARNITENITIQIPARDIPSFKPAKSFVEEVDK